MTKNNVAANLLMFIILASGVVGITKVKQEVFPAFDLDMILISVAYPGASPAETEQGIVLAIEEINKGGGVLGRPLKLVAKDHRGNPARGIDNMTDFANMHDLVAVVGGIHTRFEGNCG